MGFHTPDKPVQTQDATDKWIPGINPYAAELFRAEIADAISAPNDEQ